ncbi:hypothetical protein GP486_001756 [Trichoglossum hirsutum]|uniref:Glucose-methanol-choline oxidoreductase N-terminal domain-containing protein n=1 Tax=Trichoglossum hirsutum TaxID=265104 RepID=A0A9P8LG39_9PEZI|nr:hypothetical protein GP486_001756 [Trichoglossum hirsutum]
MWIDPSTGLRQDVPHRLIYPILDAGNTKLRVLTESKVIRVLFDQSKRAAGIEYTSKLRPSADGLPTVVRARKLVVVSAGALGSPLILQRSGVGNEKKLSSLGIPTVSAVNGVGTNYLDHSTILTTYHSNAKPEDTLDGLVSGRLPFEEALREKSLSASTYILGWNGVDGGAKLRPSPEEVKAMGPQFEKLWNRDFRDRPSRPLILIATVSSFLGDPSSVTPGQYFTIAQFTTYPYSQGSIHIAGPSVDDPPDFDSGLLKDPTDVTELTWAYKKQRDLVRRMKHYAGALETDRPRFRVGSKAGFKYVDGKQALGEWGDIEYDKEDDEAIEQYIRENARSSFHCLGTCAMKPLEDGGVVDKRLNVYGVDGLKVADLSICPKNVAANTYSTALVIGEKAAMIIAEELGIKLHELVVPGNQYANRCLTRDAPEGFPEPHIRDIRGEEVFTVAATIRGVAALGTARGREAVPPKGRAGRAAEDVPRQGAREDLQTLTLGDEGSGHVDALLVGVFGNEHLDGLAVTDRRLKHRTVDGRMGRAPLPREVLDGVLAAGGVAHQNDLSTARPASAEVGHTEREFLRITRHGARAPTGVGGGEEDFDQRVGEGWEASGETGCVGNREESIT